MAVKNHITARTQPILRAAKMTIAGSMSLGVTAGACGIIRTIVLGGISSKNYTYDTVSLIIWSAVELAVTMICIGIPVLPPLLAASTYRYYKHDQGADVPTSDVLHMKEMAAKDEIDLTERASRSTRTAAYCEHGHNESDEVILGPERQRLPVRSRGLNGIHVANDVRVEIGPSPS